MTDVNQQCDYDMAGVPYFFLHVMKTGGTTFVRELATVFPPEQRYPFLHGDGRIAEYSMIEELRRLTPEARRRVRLYCGHFPFAATTIVEPVVRMTMLRDPVERTVSILRQFRRANPAEPSPSLEELYEHPFIFPLYVQNYQVKLFAMTHGDKLESHRDVIDVDESRLKIAKDNLERIDVLGLAHRHDEFLDDLRGRFGWRFGGVPDQRVSSEGWQVSPSFRRRIAADNRAEMEFWDHALSLHQLRRSA